MRHNAEEVYAERIRERNMVEVKDNIWETVMFFSLVAVVVLLIMIVF